MSISSLPSWGISLVAARAAISIWRTCAGATKTAFPSFASFGEESKPKTSTAQDGWAAF